MNRIQYHHLRSLIEETLIFQGALYTHIAKGWDTDEICRILGESIHKMEEYMDAFVDEE